MRDISNLELAVLLKELEKEVKGLFLEKFYEDREGKFRFKLEKKGTQMNLQCILSKTINKTNFIEKSDTPTNFALAVRKRIEGFSIEDIEQYNNDRIILVKLRKGEERTNIIIEMFGKGNLIICDDKMEIMLPYYQQEFKERNIKKGIAYMPPKNQLAKVPEIPSGHESYLYRGENGKAVDYSLGKNPKHEGMKAERFQTLQEALDAFYYEKEMELKGKEQRNPEAEELENSIRKQRSIVDGIQAEIDAAKEKGDRIMSKMHEINQTINEAKADKRITKEELQSRTKTKILNVDLKEKMIEIEVE